MAELETFSRQRIDYSMGPSGETIATLTVTLGDGSVHRYKGSATEKEVDKLAKGIADAEVKAKRISGEIAGMSEDEISGFWGSIVKSVKKVGKVARKIASSKAFKWAGKGLVAISPMLGPFGAATAAVGGGMMLASHVSDMSIAAEAGAKKVARGLGINLHKKARSIARRPATRRKLINWANNRRKSVFARATGRRYTPPRRRAPVRRRRPSRGGWMARIRAAALRARSRRPAFPRYASTQYPQPAYRAPWGRQQRALPRRWQG